VWDVKHWLSQSLAMSRMCLLLRLLFWSDWGRTAKIEQSYLDGTNRRAIIDTDLGLFSLLYGSVESWPDVLTLYQTWNRVWTFDPVSENFFNISEVDALYVWQLHGRCSQNTRDDLYMRWSCPPHLRTSDSSGPAMYISRGRVLWKELVSWFVSGHQG